MSEKRSVEAMDKCPFRSEADRIGLEELPGILRLGQRARLARARRQLLEGMRRARDEEEATGMALLFISVLVTTALEMTGRREHHLTLLRAVRELEAQPDRKALEERVGRLVDELVRELYGEADGIDPIVGEAIRYLEEHLGERVTAERLAARLGWSPSHFRARFRRATGLPFHRYVQALRLEHARRMIVEEDRPIGEVALAVGFVSPAHFSRAFAQRFAVSPRRLRRTAEESRDPSQPAVLPVAPGPNRAE